MPSTQRRVASPPAAKGVVRNQPAPLRIPDEVLEALPYAVLLLTPKGLVLQSNAAATSLLAGEDWPAADLVGTEAALLFDRAIGPDADVIQPVQNPIRACLSLRSRVVEQQLGLVRGLGEVQWVQVRVTPIRHRTAAAQSPFVDSVLVVAAPHLEPDADGLVLRERDQQFSVAQRMARLSMWRWDIGSEEIAWWDGTGRNLGISAELKGLDAYLEGIHPADRHTHDAMFQSLLTSASSAEIDLRYRCHDGWRHWHMWAESVRDARGEVAALLGTTQDVTERRAVETARRRVSMTDSLTELANRAQILERVSTALAEYPPQHEVGLVLLDIDRFRNVNDRLGPVAGDLLLIEVGQRLRQLCGPDLTPGRLAADQFVVVLARTTQEHARDTAQRAFGELSRAYQLPGVAEPVHVSVSAGYTVCERTSAQSTRELLRHSEIAVSCAQSRGGGQIVAFDDDLRSQALGRLNMEGRLRDALSHDNVLALFQPVLTLGEGPAQDTITSCEALARIDDHGTLIPPSEFVGVAEESDLIRDLDLAVCTQAVHRILARPPAPQFAVAVNFSARSLQSPGLGEQVAAVLAEAGVDGGALRVEITESCLADPTALLLRQLQELRELGAQIGLDDFGTGYSALGYLSRFDLDFIKIDRSFVADLQVSARARAVVRAVIDLAHAHELTVVAEGVETGEQLRTLRGMRCDMVQGFHVGRPTSRELLVHLVEAGRGGA